jgi:flavin reductase (DIM6/NTAB) family NADH-FMN oxidoreductase RutF
MATSNELTPGDGSQFRTVLGHFPTSVVAITTTVAGGHPRGMVVGSFTSVSLDPPLVSFLVDHSSTTLPAIRDAGRFCANALASDQERLARSMAARGRDRFGGVDWQLSPLDNPVLTGIVAWVDCTVEKTVELGDHALVVGRVCHLSAEAVKTPLIFFRGGYGDYQVITTHILDNLVGW